MTQVVFIHHGRRFDWLPQVLEQARQWNDEVICISDQPEKTHDVKDYSNDYSRFEKAFLNHSTNPTWFEGTAFSRWIILNEYVHKHNIDVVFHLDTDVMLFANAESEYEKKFKQYPISLVLGECGATCYFTAKHLAGLSELIMRTYIDRNEDYEWLVNLYTRMQEQGLPGGANDMVLAKLYRLRNCETYGEMTDIRDGEAYDHTMRESIPGGYRMRDGMKEIEFRRGIPYATIDATGQKIRMMDLHFQGDHDLRIPEYVQRIKESENG